MPVAGTLVAVGRPDGRCNALTGSESAVCLSVLQASSIQHLGVCCESITLGHNQFKLPLTANHIALSNGQRPKFLSEMMMATTMKDGASPGTILGLLEQLKVMVKKHKDAERQRTHGALGNPGLVTNRRVKRFSSETDIGIQSDLLRASVPSLLNLLQGDKSQAGRRASKMYHVGSVGDRLAAMDEDGLEVDDEEADPKFYGSRLRKLYPELTPVELMDKQVLLQRLYESRCASLHRLVSVSLPPSLRPAPLDAIASRPALHSSWHVRMDCLQLRNGVAYVKACCIRQGPVAQCSPVHSVAYDAAVCKIRVGRKVATRPGPC